MGELSKLTNIGKELEKQLNEIGIKTFDELRMNLPAAERRGSGP
jgi:predicted flap endonuclease-1-like 5' DNA nuclease